MDTSEPERYPMIGILGGSFDPIHHGHLRTALDVQQTLDLDEVRIVPVSDPPHRTPPMATVQQRLAMIEAAIHGLPGFRLDPQEIRREGKSYTVRTLRHLRQSLGDVSLCLIIGSDAFRDFPKWHTPDEILQLAHLIVMQRPDEQIPDHYPNCHTHDPSNLSRLHCGVIYTQPVTQLQISSTQIRTLLKQGRSPRYLLPDSTLAIIQEQQIYVKPPAHKG